MKKLRLPEIKNKANVILYACMLIGIVLRLFQLDGHSITAAEYSNINFASGKNILEVILSNAANNNQAPLYYLITYVWTLIFGFSELSVRLLPAIFGIISVLIVHKLTRSFYSEKVSVIATSLFALSPFQIYFSQFSGANTLLLMTSLLMVYYFMLSVKYNSFVIGPFIFWTIASLYSGHMSILLLFILNVILFIRYKEEIRINLWLRAQIFILLAWLPLIVCFIKGNMLMPAHMGNNIILAPLLSLKNMLLGYTLDVNLLTIVVIVAAALFILIGVITCRTIKEKRMTDIMSLILFSMVIITWLTALFNKSQYLDSELLIAGTMLIIILSIGISHLSREGMVIFTVVTITFFSVSIYSYFGEQKWQAVNYKTLYMEIVRNFKEGDIIIHTRADSYGPFEFYNKFVYKRNYPDKLAGFIPEFKGNLKVRDKWRKIKQFLSEKVGMDIYAGYDSNIKTAKELKTIISPGMRVWLIKTANRESEPKTNDEIWAKNLYTIKDIPVQGAIFSLLIKK